MTLCGGVMGTGGGGGPGEVLLVLWPGGARGAGAWAYADPWVHRHRLRFGVGIRGGDGSWANAGCRQTSGVCRGAETLLVDPGVAPVQSGWSTGLCCGL